MSVRSYLHFLAKLSFIFLLPIVCFGQTTKWNFEVVEMPGGLGGNKVQDIIQDRQGYLWIGSQNGMHRYDGNSFKSFVHNPLDTNTISDDYIESLYEDRNGFIWVGTVGNGLSRFDPRTEKFSRYSKGILDPGSGAHTLIGSIAEDEEGNIWVASLSGLSKYDVKSKEFKKYKHDPQDPNSISHDLATVLYNDRSGNFWIGTGFYWFSGTEGGLNRYVPEKDHFIRYQHNPQDTNTLSHNSIWSIIEDQEGNFWVGSGGGNGLHLMDRTTGTFTRYPYNPNQPHQLSAPNTKALYKDSSVGLRRIMEDQSGDLWLLGYDRGLSIYNKESQSTVFYPLEGISTVTDFLPTNRIFDITETKDGSVWLASGSSGPVIRALPRRSFLRYYDLATYGIENTEILKVYEDRQSNIWLGLSRGQFIQFNPDLSDAQVFQNTSYPKGAPSAGSMRVIFEDQSRNMWIGINNSIEHFDPSTNNFRPIQIPLPTHSNIPTEQPIYALNQEQAGQFWIGTLSWGLFHYDSSQDSFRHFHPDLKGGQKIGGRSISKIFLDEQKQLWVTGGNIPIFVPTLNAGFLDQWSVEKQAFIHHLPDGENKILGRMPMSVEEDREGILWFVSWGGGLHAYNPKNGELNYFNPTIGNFPDLDTRWLVIDRQNNTLWIGTRHDVYRFDPQTFQYEKFSLFADKPGENVHGKAVVQKSGHILFAWGNGLFQFNPEQYELEKSGWKASQLLLADLYVNEKKVVAGSDKMLKQPLSETEDIFLRYSENRFGIEVHNFHFQKPELNRVEYKLEPYDLNWQNLGESQIAQYNQVLPGHYKFTARGYSSEGLSSGTISLNIEISPPWWRSQWAYLGYAGLLLGALFLASRQIVQRERLKAQLKLEQVEKEKVQEIDQLRTRFFANISHEFRTPLTLIKAPLEDLLTSRKTHQDLITFTNMHQNTERLLQLVNQLLDLSRLESGILELQPEKISIYPFLRQLAGNFQSIAVQKQLDFQIQIPEETLYLNVDQDKFEKIILNLLSNAFKFVPENGWVKIKAEFADFLRVTVGNNGIPIPVAEQDKIFDRFYQTGDTRHQGSGIGLALVREFVELHNGSLGVESSSAQGTLFWVELPLSVSPAIKTPSIAPFTRMTPIVMKESTSPLPSMHEFAAEKPVLLLVEDHNDVRTYIRQKLKGQFKIIEASDGKEGLEQAIEILPDLIISDVMMPVMDGVSFCKEIKSDRRTDHIPVILLTAKADIESRLLGLRTGADDYLAKPFNNEELLLRSQNLIVQRQKLRSHYQQNLQSSTSKMGVSKLEAHFIKKAIDIIELQLDNPDFTAEDFAQNMHLSRQHLHRKLKSITGMSATDFMRNLRLERAVELLGNGTHSVAQTAYEVGFNNLSYFSKCFKKKYKYSPSEFIKHRQSGK